MGLLPNTISTAISEFRANRTAIRGKFSEPCEARVSVKFPGLLRGAKANRSVSPPRRNTGQFFTLATEGSLNCPHEPSSWLMPRRLTKAQVNLLVLHDFRSKF